MSPGNGDGAPGTTPKPRNDHTATSAAATPPQCFQTTAEGHQDRARGTLLQALDARGVEPLRVAPAEQETRTPHRRRHAATVRTPPLPGFSRRNLGSRDPALAHQLALQIEGHSAYVVGVPRGVARDLALDAGLRTMFSLIRRAQAVRTVDVEEFVAYALARGHTCVLRPEVAGA